MVAGFKNLAHIERVVADPDHSWLPAAAVGVAARTAGETVPVWRQSGRGIHVDAPPRRNGRIDPPTGHCACQEVDGARGRPQSELRHRLWNDAPDKIGRGGASRYESAVLEQYRLYVEMADRVSARRGLPNSFFLTLNTGIVSLIVAFGKTPPEGKTWWLAILLAAILGQCFAWLYLVRSYRLLNSAKYQVVGASRNDSLPHPSAVPSGGP